MHNQIADVEKITDRPDNKPAEVPKKNNLADQIEGVEKIVDRPDRR